MAGDVQKYADGDEEGHERRTSVTDERERDSRKRDDIEVYAHVDERLHQYPRYDAYRYVLGERIVDPAGDAVSPVRHVAVARHEHHDAEESELFRDNREDEVALYFGEVPEFLDRLSESESEEPSASDGDEPLFRLEVDRLVRDGRLVVGQEVIDALRNVRKRVAVSGRGLAQSVDGAREEAEYEKRHQDVLGVSASDEEHDDRYRGDKEDGSEVRLQRQEKHDRSEKRHIGQISSFERMDFRSSPLQEVREIQDSSEFHELHRLE